MKGWHFVGETLRGGRPVPADGEWLEHEGKVVPCESGLHISKWILNALRFAPADTRYICRVELAGTIVAHKRDKHAGSRRRIIYRVDAEPVLDLFTRRCALDVVDLWEAPDVVLRFLKTGDPALRGEAWERTWWWAGMSMMSASASVSVRASGWASVWGERLAAMVEARRAA